MLEALYRYAVEHELAAVPGFREKKVACYIMLARDGSYVGITVSPKPKVFAPDIGSKANGDSFCNILVEKACYPLLILADGKDADTEKKNKSIRKKHDFYLSALQSGAACDPAFAIVYAALSDEENLDRIRNAFLQGHKPSEPIGFEVDGVAVESGTAYHAWWESFRAQWSSASNAQAQTRCLITGSLAPAMETVPKVSGLLFVGGHTSGDAFLCFDKDAFQSYGLRKSMNAPVSEEAMTAVNAALNELIVKASTLGGAKMVYWYDQLLQPEVNPVEWVLDVSFGQDETETDDDAESIETVKQNEREALSSGARLMRALAMGEVPECGNARYYIMPLSGVNGRVMVRGWYEGSFDSLYANTIQWFNDLRLTAPFGGGVTRPPKLKALAIRLLKPGGDPKKTLERTDKELSALLGRLFYAVVTGTLLPDAVAVKALYWLRSQMLTASSKDSDEKANDSTARARANESLVYQLLKAWLVRKQRAKGKTPMKQELNSEYPGVAYHCGRLMATYAVIQQKALGDDIGAGVIERYYASASTSPSLVIGKLAALSNHHLSKMENKGDVVFYNRLLDEIYTKIGTRPIPTMLDMEQRTEFALGYYQQRAMIFAPHARATDE